MSGTALAAAAADLVGARFRLHGRDPASGLDCVGVLAAALETCGRKHRLPTGYTLRLRDFAAWVPAPELCGFAPATAPYLPGDAILFGLDCAQFHLAIAAADGGWIHAHAGLRKVIHSAALPAGRIVQHWRLLPES